MSFDKVRFRFRKDGDLRLVSHHDLMRAFERMLRRASLPFRSTEGFHPQPRLIFALSLPLGVAGLSEVVEIEWTEPLEPNLAAELLSARCPTGLAILSARRIDMKQSARVRRAFYSLAVPLSEIEGIRERCDAVIAAAELWVERERPTPRQVNIRPYLDSLHVAEGARVPCSESEVWMAHLQMALWVTPEGSARADELVRVLELDHVLETGAFLQRTALEILDEIDPSEAAASPVLPSREDRAALVRPSKKPAAPVEASTAHAAHWGASPSGPIVE